LSRLINFDETVMYENVVRLYWFTVVRYVWSLLTQGCTDFTGF